MINMETEQRALLNAILADPDDDAPRLIYADVIREHGEEELADLIQVQIELSRNPDSHRSMRVRENNLLNVIFRDKKLPNSVKETKFSSIWFVRGFVGSVSCDYKQWEMHADNVLSECPVSNVKLLKNPSVAVLGVSIRGERGFLYTIGDMSDGKKAYLTRDEAHAEWASRWPTVKFEFAPELHPLNQLNDQLTRLEELVAQNDQLLSDFVDVYPSYIRNALGYPQPQE